MALALLPDRYAVCRLPADAAVPAWATGPFLSITRTADELSVVCIEEAVPNGVRCERAWRCLRVAGTLDFSFTGVLASLLVPLAEAGISDFTLSTFDTDYVLVKETDLERAIAALRADGIDTFAQRTGHGSKPGNTFSCEHPNRFWQQLLIKQGISTFTDRISTP